MMWIKEINKAMIWTRLRLWGYILKPICISFYLNLHIEYLASSLNVPLMLVFLIQSTCWGDVQLPLYSMSCGHYCVLNFLTRRVCGHVYTETEHLVARPRFTARLSLDGFCVSPFHSSAPASRSWRQPRAI